MSRQSAGGFARAASLTAERRSEIARDAANARWSGERKPKKTKPKRIKPVQHPHINLKAQPTTTDLNSVQASICRWCGSGGHGVLCPMVKTYRYYPDGTLHEVEFHKPTMGAPGEEHELLRWARTCVPLDSDCHKAIVAFIEGKPE